MAKVNYLWRRAVTVACFISYALIGCILALLALPIAYGKGRVNPQLQFLTRQAIHYLCRLLIAVLQFTGCMKLDVRNRQALGATVGQEGQLLIANHPTYLDIVVLFSLVPDALCIVKSSAMNWPWSRSFVRLAGYVSNQYPEQALALSMRYLQEGKTIIMFPEGTRSPAGGLGIFQRGAANLILRVKAHLQPVILNCYPLSLAKHQAWHDVPDQPYQYTVVPEGLPSGDDSLEAIRQQSRPIQVKVRTFNHALHRFFLDKLKVYGYVRNSD
ncbi:lysophospholipid acyltransferase family protein [Parvibium lacunae]|nr:lysophospholipid acyltransferase family protein [Parvibium lacunae]